MPAEYGIGEAPKTSERRRAGKSINPAIIFHGLRLTMYAPIHPMRHGIWMDVHSSRPSHQPQESKEQTSFLCLCGSSTHNGLLTAVTAQARSSAWDSLLACYSCQPIQREAIDGRPRRSHPPTRNVLGNWCESTTFALRHEQLTAYFQILPRCVATQDSL
jgi:hypothetical protein